MTFLFAACSKDSVNNESEQVFAPVTVRVDGFSIAQGEFPTTRGTAIADYSSVKAITLAFYA